MKVLIQDDDKFHLIELYVCGSHLIMHARAETVVVPNSGFAKAIDTVKEYCQDRGMTYLGEAVPVSTRDLEGGEGPEYRFPVGLANMRAAKNAGL